MNPLLQIGPASLLLSAGIALIAILLVVLHWYEQRGRGPDLSSEDADHFGRQGVRRLTGLIVMLLLAAGIYAGSRISPRAGANPNPVFVQTWLAVFVLIFFLLVLAILDWNAIRAYARRQRDAIVRERLAIMKDEVRYLYHPGGGLSDLPEAGTDPLD